MTVSVELDEAKRKRLAALASIEKVSPEKLLERIVSTYLDSPEAVITLAGREADQKVVSFSGLYRWDDSRGVISFMPANRRVLLFTAHAWDILEDALESTLLKAAGSFLFEMGAVYGKALALDYRSVTDDPEDVKGYFEYLGLAAGWGRMTILGDLASGSRITVKVENCVFCNSRNLSVSRVHSCQFLMGVSKGITDTVFNSPHSVVESKCSSRGDEHCEIILTMDSSSKKTTGGWGIKVPAQFLAAWR